MADERAQIRFVNYHNKTRKGTYLEVKRKGQKRKTFRYDENVPIDVYVRGYLAGWNNSQFKSNIRAWGKNARPEDKVTRNQYRKYLKSKGTLSSKFGKGVTSAQVNLTDLAQPNTISRLYRKLLEPLLLDKSLLTDILGNREKLRYRLGFRLDLIGTSAKDKSQRTIGRVTDIGHRTIEEVFNIYHNKLGYRSGTTLSQGRIPSDVALLGLPKGSGQQFDSSPTVDHVIVTITFQRG